MVRLISISVLALTAAWFLPSSAAQETANGSVIKFVGQDGELIASRDGITYWLSVGDEVFEGDVLRAQFSDAATVTYDGCVIELPKQQDVTLSEGICSLAIGDQPTMAELAADNADGQVFTSAPPPENAPLVVGSTVLAAGGLVDAIYGGNGGTDSAASREAGAPVATASSPLGNN